VTEARRIPAWPFWILIVIGPAVAIVGPLSSFAIAAVLAYKTTQVALPMSSQEKPECPLPKELIYTLRHRRL
jgi:hypothetical protein